MTSGTQFFGTNKQFATTDTYTWANDNLKPIDSTVSRSLSYTDYIKLNDSIKTIRKLKNGDYPIGRSAFMGDLIGTAENLHCDTCSIKWIFRHFPNVKEENNVRYYLKLPGWKIKDAKWVERDIDSVRYYVKNDQAYIRKTIELYDKSNPKTRVLQLVDIPVKFRYSQMDQCIMIPVSKSTKNIFTTLLLIIGVILILYFFYLISAFLKFIADLSKGLAFTDKNVWRLRLIALSLIVYPLSIFLLNLLMKPIFHSYFTSDVILNNDIWIGSWKMVAAGLVFLTLWKAFRQGKVLKEEQDLTV
jgi:hypothetical protein